MVIPGSDFQPLSAGRLGRAHRGLQHGYRGRVSDGFLAVSGAPLYRGVDYVIGCFCIGSELGRSSADAYVAVDQRASADPGAFLSASQASVVDTAADGALGKSSRGVRTGDRAH